MRIARRRKATSPGRCGKPFLICHEPTVDLSRRGEAAVKPLCVKHENDTRNSIWKTAERPHFLQVGVWGFDGPGLRCRDARRVSRRRYPQLPSSFAQGERSLRPQNEVWRDNRGEGNNSQAGTNTINVSSGVSYFRVDKDGNIEFPIFGTIHVGGMTTGEVSSMIQERMKNEGYVYDAVVNTKIMSFKVTVMGDVKNPGTQTYQGERLTILEALGKAGDLNNSAYRNNVLVIREENGQRKAYEVNLLDNQSVFSSPAYYLQQNDVIYVQPNKSQRVKGSTSYTWLSVGSTVVGMIVSIVSLIVALKK